MIDTAELGIFSLPMDILKKIISTAAAHYVGSLEKLYLLNPSTGLNMSWSVISSINLINYKSLLMKDLIRKYNFYKRKIFLNFKNILIQVNWKFNLVVQCPK